MLAGVITCATIAPAEKIASFKPGQIWRDTSGETINAHGGGVLLYRGTYYWFGEHRSDTGRSAGVGVYSSADLYNWKNGGVALTPSEDANSEVTLGCVMERPKVLYNAKTKKFVMWFHLELKGQGYKAARAGVAVADRVTGPYKYLGSFRPNGNMSRDMNLFRDDDGKAYLIFASRDNYDLHICQLSADYLSPTEKDVMVFSEHREAPAIFKYRGKYYLITSACTGWKPNAARFHTADAILGSWTSHGNPARGAGSETTFDSQSTFVLPAPGRKDAFIFMADQWRPRDLRNSPYVWLPVRFENGLAVLDWMDEWDLSFFDRKQK